MNLCVKKEVEAVVSPQTNSFTTHPKAILGDIK